MCVTAQKVANPSMGCSMIFEGLPNTPSPRRPLMVNSGADIIVVVVRTSSRGTFARFPHRRQRPSPRRRRRRLVLGRRGGRQRHAVEAETEQRSRRRARQSIRDYELI